MTVRRFGDCTLYCGDSADVLADLPEASIDAVVTDPPYGLSAAPDMAEVLQAWITGADYTHGSKGFMGKDWDNFVPGPALWSEVSRTMKPGAHVLAFAGSRTYDLMAVGMRIADFEIRDQIMWLYGSGFPKSHDISKAIDKLDASDARLQRPYKFTKWFVDACTLTPKQMDKICSTNTMGRHWTDVPPKGKQPDVPTREYFEMLRPHIPGDVPDWVEKLVDERTVESENFKKRKVTATNSYKVSEDSIWGRSSVGGRFKIGDHTFNETASHTDAAREWDGWGTALKPAHEPLVLARKPFRGSVAANVLEHGTGAINIDDCRVGVREKEKTTDPRKTSATYGAIDSPGEKLSPPGRWPANVMHDGSDEVLAGFPETKSTRGVVTSTPGAIYGAGGGLPSHSGVYGHNDSGSAARFFYTAKASPWERDFGLEHIAEQQWHQWQTGNGASGAPSSISEGRNTRRRNMHPTVKPIRLMCHLIRLITPPGGTVLDPFMSSGTTGIAATLEGRPFIGIERDPEYFEIACARIEAAHKQRDTLRKKLKINDEHPKTKTTPKVPNASICAAK